MAGDIEFIQIQDKAEVTLVDWPGSGTGSMGWYGPHLHSAGKKTQHISWSMKNNHEYEFKAEVRNQGGALCLWADLRLGAHTVKLFRVGPYHSNETATVSAKVHVDGEGVLHPGALPHDGLAELDRVQIEVQAKPDAADLWADAVIQDVEAGDTLRIKSSGQVSLWGNIDKAGAGPEGYVDHPLNASALAPTLTSGALIAKIGDEGEVKKVGRKNEEVFELIADQTGDLHLAINDVPHHVHDNTGHFSVVIEHLRPAT